MAHDADALRPETVALDALIKATVDRLRAQSDPGLPDAMLFMGNWHQAVPAMVIQVAEARQDRAHHVPPPENEEQKSKAAEERARNQAYGREQLAKLRASLNRDK